MAAENDTLYCSETGITYSGVDHAEGESCPANLCSGVLMPLGDDDDSDLDMRSCNETRLPCGCILVLPGPDDAPEDVAAIQWCATHAAASEMAAMIREVLRAGNHTTAALRKVAGQGWARAARALLAKIEAAR